jgi:hypothetical protein
MLGASDITMRILNTALLAVIAALLATQVHQMGLPYCEPKKIITLEEAVAMYHWHLPSCRLPRSP